MPTINPTVQTYPNGLTPITSLDSTTYEELLSSLGKGIVYKIKNLYLKTSTNEEALEPIKFVKKDVNGAFTNFFKINTIDPYQKQGNIIDTKIADKNFILDSQSSLVLDLLPNENIKLYLDVEVSELAEMLSVPSLLNELPDMKHFFDEYDDEIDLNLQLNRKKYQCN